MLEAGRERRDSRDRRTVAAAALGALVLVLAAGAFALLRDEGEKDPAPSATSTEAAPASNETEARPSIQLSERQIVRPGESGQQVRRLQRALNALGYNVGPPDGVFGRRTVTQLRRFQRDANLTPDGVAGRKTLRALNGALARQ